MASVGMKINMQHMCAVYSHATVDLMLMAVDQMIEHWKEPTAHVS